MMMPFIAARLQEWQVVTGAMLITSFMLAVYPFTETAWLMGACSVLVGLSLGGVQPMIMSTLHHITPESQRSQALALRLMAINFSSVLMPLLFGSAGAVLGVSVLFWSVGSAVGLGARAAWRLRI
jgi:MFS-type transporter involved in bile tolerance (Atg22 family)